MSTFDDITRDAIIYTGETVKDYFAPEVVRRIGGSPHNTETIRANCDTDDELSGGVDGSGIDPSSASGQRIAKSMIMDVVPSTTVLVGDVIEYENELWSVVRVVGRDVGMVTWFCLHIDGGNSKRARVRP